MKSQTREFKKRIKSAKSILILTHKGPDLDAFCSMLATYGFLKDNFSKKEITLLAKQQPTINIPLMKDINIVEKIENQEADLVIVTDASNLSLCLEDGIDTFESSNIVYLDHHSVEVEAQKIFTINEYRSSATEQVYATFKDMFGKRLRVSKDVAELIQYGIVSDTGRFLYSMTSSDTFRIFADVKDISPIDMEEFTQKNTKFPKETTPAIIKYLESLTIEKDMAYMYIDREDVDEINIKQKGVNEAQSFLRDRYIRNIQGVHWGFIIKPDFDKEDSWYVSFRSTKGYQDVSNIAEELGGGGHIYASAVPMTGKSAKEVLDKVLVAVSNHQS